MRRGPDLGAALLEALAGDAARRLRPDGQTSRGDHRSALDARAVGPTCQAFKSIIDLEELFAQRSFGGEERLARSEIGGDVGGMLRCGEVLTAVFRRSRQGGILGRDPFDYPRALQLEKGLGVESDHAASMTARIGRCVGPLDLGCRDIRPCSLRSPRYTVIDTPSESGGVR